MNSLKLENSCQVVTCANFQKHHLNFLSSLAKVPFFHNKQMFYTNQGRSSENLSQSHQRIIYVILYLYYRFLCSITMSML